MCNSMNLGRRSSSWKLDLAERRSRCQHASAPQLSLNHFLKDLLKTRSSSSGSLETPELLIVDDNAKSPDRYSSLSAPREQSPPTSPKYAPLPSRKSLCRWDSGDCSVDAPPSAKVGPYYLPPTRPPRRTSEQDVNEQEQQEPRHPRRGVGSECPLPRTTMETQLNLNSSQARLPRMKAATTTMSLLDAVLSLQDDIDLVSCCMSSSEEFSLVDG